jgi:hypothetical protein
VPSWERQSLIVRIPTFPFAYRHTVIKRAKASSTVVISLQHFFVKDITHGIESFRLLTCHAVVGILKIKFPQTFPCMSGPKSNYKVFIISL